MPTNDPGPIAASVSLTSIPAPVWLPEDSPARPLFVQSTAFRPRVLFFGSCVTPTQDSTELPEDQLTTVRALARSLPLFLAESAFMHFGFDTRLMLPCLPDGGLVTYATPRTYGDTWDYAANIGARGAVAISLTPKPDGVEVYLQMWKFAWRDEGEPAGDFRVDVPYNNLSMVFVIWTRLSGLFPQILNTYAPPPAPQRYGIPAPPDFDYYLRRLEQLLAIRCIANSIENHDQVFPIDPAIVQGEIHLALQLSGSLPLRLLLHETLLTLKPLRPDVVNVFQPPVVALQQSHPLADPEAAAVLDAQLKTIYPL